MRTAMTGGGGFIGVNSAGRLTQDSTGSKRNVATLPTVVSHDESILDAALLDEVMEGASSVFPLAARASVPRYIASPVASHEANARGTHSLLKAARPAWTIAWIRSS